MDISEDPCLELVRATSEPPPAFAIFLQENLTGARGLEAGREEQTFEVAVPVQFRMQVDRIYQALAAVSACFFLGVEALIQE